jgi:hypothetical protein
VNGTDFPVRLLDGEKILWSGRPGQGLLFTAPDWFLIPFSLLWCGFVIFWEAMVLHSKAPGFFALWGVPFILAGLYFTVGRFVIDAYLRGNTRYALTNRRILIARSGAFGKVTSVSLDRLPDMQLTERADGRGTIRFGQPAPYWGWGGWSSWTPAADATPQFIAIDDAQSVFDRIQRANPGAPGSGVDRVLA